MIWVTRFSLYWKWNWNELLHWLSRGETHYHHHWMLPQDAQIYCTWTGSYPCGCDASMKPDTRGCTQRPPRTGTRGMRTLHNKKQQRFKKKKNLLAEFWQLLLKPDERSKKCHHAERHPCSLHDRWVTPHEASNCWKSMYCNLIPLICMLIIPNTHTILCCWLITAILALQFSLIAARCSLWARSWFGWGVINTPWKQLNSY